MKHISHKIHGIPYGKNKTRGDISALEKWTQAVIDQTKHLIKVEEACILRVTFLLPQSKFPKDFPYGPDLDNLIKRFLDALNHTIFSETEGKDSCVIEMSVIKAKVDSKEEAGALIEVLPIRVD
ncbi:MAG: RusA family crossover junction endodeoxyribonuclease [Sedimentisphaerales bacterium]|jgi:Holliday junction resolvase RusA-like endonuclease